MKLITVHLGNGCSLAAIDHGRSIDTSMGFTPLEGLLMGTRTGDMDPAIVAWLMAMEEMTLHQVNTMMNKHSGLYGVSGVSSDMRELVEARAGGHQRADVAFRMFCYRVKKYIGAYAAAMGGVDAVFFTGGIGENSPEVRQWALDGLEYMGIEIDPEVNAALTGGEGEITVPGSRAKARLRMSSTSDDSSRLDSTTEGTTASRTFSKIEKSLSPSPRSFSLAMKSCASYQLT